VLKTARVLVCCVAGMAAVALGFRDVIFIFTGSLTGLGDTMRVFLVRGLISPVRAL
tara:strand:- start:928 stop:1095 length:168 start_codon:yes stop_codon:yes gene_type:complete